MTLRKPDGRWKFSAEAEPQMVDDGVGDIGVTANWQGPGVGGTQYGSITTSVVAVDGKPCPVADWYAVGRGDAWGLRLKADLLLADGTFWRDARLRQVGDAAEPWPTFTPTALDGTLPEVRGWQMRVKPIARNMIQGIVLGSDEGDEIDPFATPGVEMEYPKFGLPEAAIPEALKELATPTEPWIKISLVGKLGMKSVIEWRGRNHRPFVRLESEVNVSEDDRLEQVGVLRCRMKPPTAAALNWHAEALTGLVPGVPVLTDALKLPDGRTLRQGQRASLIQMRAE